MSVPPVGRLSNPPGVEFSVYTVAGCRLAFGALPVLELRALSAAVGKDALMAFDIAERIGATIVVGQPQAIERLRAMRLPISAQREGDGACADRLGLPAVAAWLREGERGLSSNALCRALFGVPDRAGTNYPQDVSDFSRCKTMVEATGGRDRLDRALGLSAQWRAVIGGWDALCQLYDLEAPNARKGGMPRTSARLANLLRTGHE